MQICLLFWEAICSIRSIAAPQAEKKLERIYNEERSQEKESREKRRRCSRSNRMIRMNSTRVCSVCVTLVAREKSFKKSVWGMLSLAQRPAHSPIVLQAYRHMHTDTAHRIHANNIYTYNWRMSIILLVIEDRTTYQYRLALDKI